MGGGLLQLVAYGAQDVFLTGNPQITFFKVVYRRHTNFAIESIEQTFNGTARLGSRVNVLITRNGDLINRIYFKGTLKATVGNVALVPYFGLRLLKQIELEIGGQKIDKHYSEWMYIWNELSMPLGKKDGYNKMVGGNIKNSSIYLATNNTYDVYVPLEFWFCRNVGLSLPLIALQYHEVKLSIEFCNQQEIKDTYAGNYCYNDNVIQKHSGASQNNSNHTGNVELKDVELWVDYIFLDTDERRRFAQLSHEYLIEQLQFNGSEVILNGYTDENNYSLKNVKLNFNHPCKELIWVIKPDNDSDNAEKKLTNTDDEEITVKQSDVTGKVYWNNFSNNQYNAYNHLKENEIGDDMDSDTHANIIENCTAHAKLQLNGNERFTERDGNYFSIIQPYQHHEITPGEYNKGINMYSFALKPEEHQPSGTLNMSRIDSAHLQLSSRRAGLISIFAVNYNVLRIISGMGGLAYSN